MEQEISVGHLMLYEYMKLKEEQLARIGTRDNLVYVTLASLAGVIAATLQAGIPDFLLVMAPACLVLGWTYLVNDEKISAIGRHIRTVLTPQLEDFLRSDVRLLTWEIQHRADRHRKLRKGAQLAIDLLTFCVPGVVAVAAYLLSGPRGAIMMIAAGVELVGVLFLGGAIVMNADLTKETPVHPEAPATVHVLPGRQSAGGTRTHDGRDREVGDI